MDTQTTESLAQAAAKFIKAIRPHCEEIQELQRMDDDLRHLRHPRGEEATIRTSIFGDASKAIAREREYLDNFISTMALEFLYQYDMLSKSQHQ